MTNMFRKLGSTGLINAEPCFHILSQLGKWRRFIDLSQDDTTKRLLLALTGLVELILRLETCRLKKISAEHLDDFPSCAGVDKTDIDAANAYPHNSFIAARHMPTPILRRVEKSQHYNLLSPNAVNQDMTVSGLFPSKQQSPFFGMFGNRLTLIRVAAKVSVPSSRNDMYESAVRKPNAFALHSQMASRSLHAFAVTKTVNLRDDAILCFSA